MQVMRHKWAASHQVTSKRSKRVEKESTLDRRGSDFGGCRVNGPRRLGGGEERGVGGGSEAIRDIIISRAKCQSSSPSGDRMPTSNWSCRPPQGIVMGIPGTDCCLFYPLGASSAINTTLPPLGIIYFCRQDDVSGC